MPDFEAHDLQRDRPPRESDAEKSLVDRVFRHYRALGYPHLNPTDAEMTAIFQRLCRTSERVQNGRLDQNMVGLTLANAFHPEMLTVRCRGFRTPMEVWDDDALLREALLKRIRFGSNLKPWGIRKAVMSLRRCQRVSNFRPATAKAVYEFFRPRLTVDFCAGWGGRLLGALAANVPYVGIDPNAAAIRGNTGMLDTLRRLLPGRQYEARLITACAEDVLGQGRWHPDLIFTSPPYFDVERYTEEPTQSYLRYPTLDGWYTNFLGACLAGAFRDMPSGGWLVLNVGADMEAETIRLAKGAGFHLIARWQLVLSQHQYNKRHRGTFRYEPVLVFNKDGSSLPGDGSSLPGGESEPTVWDVWA